MRKSPADEGYLTDVLHDEAVRFIEQNRQRPFFLYLAEAAMHAPLEASQKYFDRFPDLSDVNLRRTYAAAMSALDDGVGRVLDTLKKYGLERNTLIVFSSDNGGASFWRPWPEVLEFVREFELRAPAARQDARLPPSILAEAVGHWGQRLQQFAALLRQADSLRGRRAGALHRAVARRGPGRDHQRRRHLRPGRAAHVRRRRWSANAGGSPIRRRGPSPLLRGQGCPADGANVVLRYYTNLAARENQWKMFWTPYTKAHLYDIHATSRKRRTLQTSTRRLCGDCKRNGRRGTSTTSRRKSSGSPSCRRPRRPGRRLVIRGYRPPDRQDRAVLQAILRAVE